MEKGTGIKVQNDNDERNTNYIRSPTGFFLIHFFFFAKHLRIYYLIQFSQKHRGWGETSMGVDMETAGRFMFAGKVFRTVSVTPKIV